MSDRADHEAGPAPAERDEMLANIAQVPVPDQDPVQGERGPLTRLWRSAAQR